jgi:hypothetical protein
MPDEVPTKGIPVGVVLGDEVLEAILADDLHASFGEHAHVFDGGVLRRHDDGDAVPHLSQDALVVPANLLRRRRRSPLGDR